MSQFSQKSFEQFIFEYDNLRNGNSAEKKSSRFETFARISAKTSSMKSPFSNKIQTNHEAARLALWWMALLRQSDQFRALFSTTTRCILCPNLSDVPISRTLTNGKYVHLVNNPGKTTMKRRRKRIKDCATFLWFQKTKKNRNLYEISLRIRRHLPKPFMVPHKWDVLFEGVSRDTFTNC